MENLFEGTRQACRWADKPAVLPYFHIYPQNAGLVFWDHKVGLSTAYQWNSYVVSTLKPSPRVHPTLRSGSSTVKILGGGMRDKISLNFVHCIYMRWFSRNQMGLSYQTLSK